jgi:hypothetical protein
MPRLRVRRNDSGWGDRFRKYKVLLDDHEVGRLRRRETAEFEVEPGQHVVQVSIDSKRSKSFEFSGDGDELFRYRCGPNSALPALIAIFRRGENTWLSLEPDDA